MSLVDLKKMKMSPVVIFQMFLSILRQLNVACRINLRKRRVALSNLRAEYCS